MATETSIRLTYEDYVQIPDDGKRHEIIDGEHYVNPAPNLRHQLISIRLSSALYQFVTAYGLGHVFAAPCDVLLGPVEVVNPDLVFVSSARAHILTVPNIQGVPDLLIEILSTNRKYDERLKYKMYEQAGVPEYWIVDPFENTVRVFRRENDRFGRVEVGDTLSTPLLPGFELPVADVFA